MCTSNIDPSAFGQAFFPHTKYQNEILSCSSPYAFSAPSSAPSTATEAAAAAPSAADSSEFALETHDLTFSYPGLDGRPIPGIDPVVRNMSLQLPRGSLCLLVGPNGAGKTTLLKVLGGKHMVPEGSVRVLGKSPFYDLGLTSSGDLSYVGGNWERDVAFAGYSVKLQGDFPAGKMIDSVPGIDPARKERLIKVLGVNPNWRMHRVSDGQRRRVQLCLGLLKPFKLLLLDEITVDLDVVGRANLMQYLRDECETRGATVIYCTHIFDGLESWPTHLMYVASGELKCFKESKQVDEMRQGKLLELITRWLREEKAERKERERKRKAERALAGPEGAAEPLWNNGWGAGRLTSTMKLASNAVMRM